jgi:hypothetical protein
MKKTLFFLLILSTMAGAVSVLPTLGYSASSGFIFGGFLLFPLTSPPGQFTVNTYYGTAGVIKFQPGYTRLYGQGLLTSTIGYRKVIEKEWYGWGNNTDPDSFAVMDFEKANLLADFTIPVGNHFSFTAGFDVRHSSVFNREQSALLNRLPGKTFSSTWSAGLGGKVSCRYSTPLNGDLLLGINGFFQAGNVFYAGVSGKIRETLSLWQGGEIALGARAHKQFNVTETPVSYMSGLGQNENFRGYSDCRFTGSVWTLYQIEVRHDLFSLGNIEEDQGLTVGMTVFAETGEAAEEFTDISTDRLHTDYGCGLNIKLSEAAQMRLDAAWSEEGMLVQSAFGKSF